MMKPRVGLIGSLLFVAIFAFAFGLAYVSPVEADRDPCCYLAPTPNCSAGVGVWDFQLRICQYNPSNTLCLNQIAPECW